MGLLVQIGQLGAEDEHFKKKCTFFSPLVTLAHLRTSVWGSDESLDLKFRRTLTECMAVWDRCELTVPVLPQRETRDTPLAAVGMNPPQAFETARLGGLILYGEKRSSNPSLSSVGNIDGSRSQVAQTRSGMRSGVTWTICTNTGRAGRIRLISHLLPPPPLNPPPCFGILGNKFSLCGVT